MKEARLYKKLKGNLVQCGVCHNRCTLKEEQRGICGIRKNIKGKLYLLPYGKAIAVNIDPIEKKPLFHFFPGEKAFSLGTLGCNLDCQFCQNWDISQLPKLGRGLASRENSFLLSGKQNPYHRLYLQ